jgi:23S rRNA (cytosine1962-C5)-methyltransferase
VSEPWVRFEDEHLLVVTKPAGINTHRPDEHAQDGMYEWVQRQRPDATLSILHRLDKATSGLLVFGKTPDANRSLAAQFEGRSVAKSYELLADRVPQRPKQLHADEPIEHKGSAMRASTDFDRREIGQDVELWEARPHTGRTHQVRIHATAIGMPIIGDDEHGGAPGARLFLHAAALGLEHPTSGRIELSAPRPATFDRVLTGEAPDSPGTNARAAHEARALLFDERDTDAYLWIDRHHDGFPNVRVERLGDIALVLNYDERNETADPSETKISQAWLDAWNDTLELKAVYEQHRPRVGTAKPARRITGEAQPTFTVTELGCRYLIDLEASTTSSGLFLNVFAHTGSLSVAAAKAGAETLTLDLSTRYLDWARENLRANGVDPADHDFIYGDALSWMDRLAHKGRRFDVVLVDPPSTSTGSKKGTRWVAERDLHAVVDRAARLATTGGELFVSTNLRRMTWPRFLDHLTEGLHAAGRRARSVETQTLPLDHRSGPGDPPYLKAAWITLDV